MKLELNLPTPSQIGSGIKKASKKKLIAGIKKIIRIKKTLTRSTCNPSPESGLYLRENSRSKKKKIRSTCNPPAQIAQTYSTNWCVHHKQMQATLPATSLLHAHDTSVLVKLPVPRKCNYSCLQGAPLHTAFLCKLFCFCHSCASRSSKNLGGSGPSKLQRQRNMKPYYVSKLCEPEEGLQRLPRSVQRLCVGNVGNTTKNLGHHERSWVPQK